MRDSEALPHNPARWSPRRVSSIGSLAVVWLSIPLACLVIGCTTNGDEAGAAPPAGVVIANVDGDTLRIRLGAVDEPVRLIGLDTPEITHRGEPGDCYGREAADRTASLAPPGTVVSVYLDAEPRDRYGRLLAYVVVADTVLNLVLVQEGYARTLDIAPNSTLRDRLSAAERSARRESLGLWSACQ